MYFDTSKDLLKIRLTGELFFLFQTAKQIGIHVYAIGITLTDTRELEGIASAPVSDNLFNVNNFDELEGLGEKIFSALCPVQRKYIH